MERRFWWQSPGFWLLVVAVILAVYTVARAADVDRPVRDPRHPAPVATTPQASPAAHIPVCVGPLMGQCWESEDDGDVATMWRENPRAMMLPASLVAQLSSDYPSRSWAECWQYLSRPVIECPDGYVTELVP